MFLATDYTHLFFIDADIAFDAEETLRMVLTDKDVVCGAYPRKFTNWGRALECAASGGNIEQVKRESLEHVINFIDDNRSPPIDDTGCVEVAYAGTGFMLIKRSVFYTLKPHVDIYLCDAEVKGEISVNDVIHEFFYIEREPKTKRLLSEDYAFCRLWRSHGGKIHVATWLNLSHIGTAVYGRGM
jgi:hypothetical protein